MKSKRKNGIDDIYDFQRRVTLYFGLLFTVLIFFASATILNSVATVYNDVAVNETIATTERIQ